MSDNISTSLLKKDIPEIPSELVHLIVSYCESIVFAKKLIFLNKKSMKYCSSFIIYNTFSVEKSYLKEIKSIEIHPEYLTANIEGIKNIKLFFDKSKVNTISDFEASNAKILRVYSDEHYFKVPEIKLKSVNVLEVYCTGKTKDHALGQYSIISRIIPKVKTTLIVTFIKCESDFYRSYRKYVVKDYDDLWISKFE